MLRDIHIDDPIAIVQLRGGLYQYIIRYQRKLSSNSTALIFSFNFDNVKLCQKDVNSR